MEGAAVPDGVLVREVLRDSPASQAGLTRGDRVVAVDGAAVKDIAGVDEKLRDRSPGDKIRLDVQRGEEKLSPEITLGTVTDVAPADLPSAHAELADRNAGGAATGVVEIKVPEFSNECMAYVPANYAPQLKYGVVIWIHSPGGYNRDELVARWKDLCAQRDLILLAPRSADAARWHPSETKFVRRALEELMKTHKVDTQRIITHGHQAGGAMAYVIALGNRDLVHGIATVQAPLPAVLTPPEADPVNRLSMYIAAPSLEAPAIKSTIAKLRELKHPVTTDTLGGERYLDDAELSRMVNWIDSLDRI
jgi:serine protease Do